MISFVVPKNFEDYVDLFARRLARFKEEQHAKHTQNLTTTYEKRLWMNKIGCRGEGGLYFFLGRSERDVIWDTSISNDRAWGKQAEIEQRGQFYDAKGIDSEHKGLLVAPDNIEPAWRYVLVGVWEWPLVHMLGWCTGADVLTTKIQEKVPGRFGHLIKQGDPLLRDCAELIEEKVA